MRLIDADKLWKDLDTAHLFDCGNPRHIAQQVVEEQPTVNPYDWISVKDRLPEKNKDVLCCTSDKYEQPFIGYRDKYNGLWCKGRWAYTWGKITHWMPLPAPPTEQEY